MRVTSRSSPQPVFSQYASYQTITYTPLTTFSGDQSGFKQVSWAITPSTTYPTNCNCPNPGGKVDPGLLQGSETIPLVAPGSLLTPRYNQVDIDIRKKFTFREKYTLMGELQVFNLINTSTVLTESYDLGSPITPFLSHFTRGIRWRHALGHREPANDPARLCSLSSETVDIGRNTKRGSRKRSPFCIEKRCSAAPHILRIPPLRFFQSPRAVTDPMTL